MLSFRLKPSSFLVDLILQRPWDFHHPLSYRDNMVIMMTWPAQKTLEKTERKTSKHFCRLSGLLLTPMKQNFKDKFWRTRTSKDDTSKNNWNYYYHYVFLSVTICILIRAHLFVQYQQFQLKSWFLFFLAVLPSQPIFPSPSESPSSRKDLVSAAVRGLAPLQKFWRNSLKKGHHSEMGTELMLW